MPEDTYWPQIISECIEESFKISDEAQNFVHVEMIPQLFERESVENRQAFFDKINWPLLKQTSPKLWERLSKQALDVEQTMADRQQRVYANAQQQAMVNPPSALDVMQHLFGAPEGAAAIQQLDKTQAAQDKAFKPEYTPPKVLGLRQPNQRGFNETTGQGLDNTMLPMGGA